MNIFALDSSPKMAARSHYDVHVRKMILESAEMLTLAWIHHHEPFPITLGSTRHMNHPCSKWARRNTLNYRWLAALYEWLLFEYRYRFGKDHAYSGKRHLFRDVPRGIDPAYSETPFVCCMPDDYVILKDPIASYRFYYRIEKIDLRKYTRREPPEWLVPRPKKKGKKRGR